jgi:hypothetical protein
MASSKRKIVGKTSGRRPAEQRERAELGSRSDAAGEIVLRTDESVVATIRDGRVLQQAAMAWSYKVRNRIRWAERERSERRQADECRTLLVDGLGVAPAALEAIARRGIVEVSVPYQRETLGWAARIMPWEYVLASATSGLATEESVGSFMVLRHLERAAKKSEPGRRGGALIALSTPGKIAEEYELDSEAKLVSDRLDKRAFKRTVLTSPTQERLTEVILRERPALIHLGGVDTHQAAELLEEPDAARDGWLLAGETGAYDAVGAEELARILNAAGGPELVVFNLYHSASRLAALTVAGGAGLALGFQDTFDDLAAELFVGEFYRAWKAPSDALVAFQAAWLALRAQQRAGGAAALRLKGSGVVLWSARSLVRGASAARAAASKHHNAMAAARKSLAFQSREEAKQAIYVTCKPCENVNYSLLQNRQPLFVEFTLKSLPQGRIDAVRVEVELDTGGRAPSSFSWVDSLDESGADLASKVFIPLTSDLTRSIEESLATALRVKVKVAEHLIFEEQYRVTLVPYNEWVDDDQNRQFLPSFVWPLDPMVRRIVTQSQRYLNALADDPNAGFDGYQGVDAALEDPTASVDQQVAALWRGLLDERLGYINPPPSYTRFSQRLRTPTRIIEGGRGTCIDLALLLIACLEYVDIYPVMFLLDGHAFPGYWRSEAAWEEFVSLGRDSQPPSSPSAPIENAALSLGNIPWMFPSSRTKSVRRSAYRLVREQVEKGNLVPLEAVWLTTSKGFQQAQDDGWDNLAEPSEFESMIDVRSARGARPPVTPVPLFGGLK